MTTYEERMAEQWGELAQFSEYRRGDTIAYQLDGQEHIGDILWIVAAGEVSIRSGNPMPTMYIVERTDANDSIPDVIYQNDIHGLHGPQEPFINPQKE